MPRRVTGAALRAVACALLALACADPPPPAPAAPARDVRLVVLIAVDQLRADRVSESLPGGLGRLVREGRVWVDAALEHAFTETCPGHAVMLSGRHPARVGVPANSYIDPQTLEKRYCVEDRAPDAAIVGLRSGAVADPAAGRSPRILQVSGLGDWMKARHPETRVFSVSGKDRAAITLAGLHPDGVYWLARGPEPAWVTSRYYRSALPDWVASWDVAGALAALPPDWSYLPDTVEEASAGPRPDDYEPESPLLSRTQPHPLRRDPPGVERLPEAARHAADRAYVTPFADRLSLAFARDLVMRERLGTGPATDLLAVGLSSTDLVGHFYGPESWESRDALTRLDRMLGSFLDFLDRRIGRDHTVVVLTADHGVLPIPEWIQQTGRSRCPVPGGRIDAAALAARLEEHLDRELGGDGARARDWFARSGERFTLDRRLVSGDGALEARVMALATTFLESQPGIERVWTREEVLSGGGPEPLADLYRNSWVPEITGDLAVQAAEDCLLGSHRLPTSHGSPYPYDRKVPLVFMGPGIQPDKIYERQASPADIAPTLADYLGVPAPLNLDGRVLPLWVRPPGR